MAAAAQGPKLAAQRSKGQTMFMRRRRPLMGAAMMGGAVMAGRASQRRQYEREDQEARIENLEAQQQPQQAVAAAPPPAAPAPQAPTPSGLAGQLQQLADLKQSGVLSDQEFEAAKQKLLAG
jgi:Short C-terminal domain